MTEAMKTFLKMTEEEKQKYLDRWVAGDSFSKEDLAILREILWEVDEIVHVTDNDYEPAFNKLSEENRKPSIFDQIFDRVE